MSATGFGIAAAPPNTNIFVAGLPKGIDDEKLKEVFANYGEVVWCRALKEGRDGRTAGLVEFSNLEHATWVVANVNGGIPQGLTEPVDVKFKDEKGHSGGYGSWGGKGGWGDCGSWSGKGSDRYSPYGPPDSTTWDAFCGADESSWGACGFHGGKGADPNDWATSSPSAMGPQADPNAMAAPQVDPVPSDNVYIKGLPAAADEVLLKEVFSAYGTVTQCRVCHSGDTRRTALVRFQSVEESANCIAQCAGGIVPAGLSDTIEVRFADTWDTKQRRNSDGTEFSIEVIVKGFESSGLMPGGIGRYDNNNNCAVYIAGLPSDTMDHHLYKLFSPLGPIAPRGVRALLNEDGTCKGIAFVNYQREESVHAAVAVYNGAILPDGGKLKVQQKAIKASPQICHPPSIPIAESTARVVPPPPGGITAAMTNACLPSLDSVLTGMESNLPALGNSDPNLGNITACSAEPGVAVSWPNLENAQVDFSAPVEPLPADTSQNAEGMPHEVNPECPEEESAS